MEKKYVVLVDGEPYQRHNVNGDIRGYKTLEGAKRTRDFLLKTPYHRNKNVQIAVPRYEPIEE